MIGEERDGCPGKGKILPGNACSERLPRPGLSAAWRLPGDILKRLCLRDFFCYVSKQPFLCERMLQVTRVLRSPETSGICPVADTGPGATPDPWRSPWGGREGVTPHRRTPSPGAKEQPSRTREPFPGNRALEEDLETEGQYGLIGGLRTTSPLRFQRSFLEPGDSSNGKKLISLAGQ